ncbi:MAG: hypothetical protein AB7K09_12470 [Planctomycetota bacterium]
MSIDQDRKEMINAPTEEWRCIRLRFSGFTQDQDNWASKATRWWSDVAGNVDLALDRRDSAKGLVEMAGEIRPDQVLELTVRRGRIDWQLNTVVPVEVELPAKGKLPERLPDLGPFNDALQEFVQQVRKWLVSLPSNPYFHRLAFATDSKIDEGAAGGLKVLEAAVGIDLSRLADAKDVEVAFNHPVTSKAVETIKINKIRRLKLEKVVITARGPGRKVLASKEYNFIANSTDFNTQPSAETLVKGEQRALLFDELVSLTLNSLNTVGG